MYMSLLSPNGILSAPTTYKKPSESIYILWDVSKSKIVFTKIGWSGLSTLTIFTPSSASVPI